MIEQTIRVDAPPERVWAYFTDQELLARWWGGAQADPRPGGLLRVAMDGGPEPVMRGEFVELQPYERLVFTFGWEPAPGVPDIPPGGSRVEVLLTPDRGGTVVTLRHGGLPATLRGETTDGWGIVLGRLAKEAAADD
ncbi:SRPBCC family protein [Jiangella rhizosphaerae]|uniref:SRPBCC domain-containing protein n=1 Tax=Jiangella rhizosphaerae TaxID=2293569 RepID=A0A418KMG0_9ACTN|nr:SRPBCC domain-containing protein [Jiangella rhizosphaerae]RIQ19544.1 SRPBCC domain-containing protein [Jiangella rhizosphaerae]